MGKELRNLTLPAFAFIENQTDKGVLTGRNVILHVRSASVIEILNKDDVINLSENALTCEFDYVNAWGVVEHYLAALHFCATLDVETDRNLIIDGGLSPAADWFCEYMDWEDKNIIRENDKEKVDTFSLSHDVDIIRIVRNKEPYFEIKAEANSDVTKLAKALKLCAEWLNKVVRYGKNE